MTMGSSETSLFTGNSQAYVVSETCHTAVVRREAIRLANRLGFDDELQAKVALVITEASTNLLKHTVGGCLIIRSIQRQAATGLELLALNGGRGMQNVNQCLQDGYSTAGSPGTGLGAMLRCSSECHVKSWRDKGTAVVARWWLPMPEQSTAWSLDIGSVCVPKRGEAVCGDSWAYVKRASSHVFLMADGLGHGPLAASASHAAVKLLRDEPSLSPVELIEAAHRVLNKTRGAALAVAELDLRMGHVRFAGVGNIAGAIITANRAQHLVSYNGIVGHELRKVQEFTYPWSDQALLVLHSDGLSTQWNLDDYTHLKACDPSLIAGILYRDFNRGRDDATVVVAREQADAKC
jgi:anti-sigma regulatory factor (Ser/Thr protein kinase)